MRFVIEANEAMVNCALGDPGWRVIDARASDAYIGWTRPGGARGGHLLYAELFSAAWLDPGWKTYSGKVEAQLELQLTSQDITPEMNVIIYDEGGGEAERVCDYLGERGFQKLFYFDLRKWTGDLIRYPNYRLLAPVWWVKDLIDGKRPHNYDGQGFKIFETSWKAPSQQYLEAHIPGAVHIDTNGVEAPPEWTRGSDEKLIQFALNNGITPDTTVIVYANDELGAPAKLSAVLRYLGVKKVLCLHGTLRNWLAAGYPTESGCPEKQPCLDKTVAFTIDHTQIRDINEAKAMLADPALGTVVDTRGWRQYIGEDSGYEYVPIAGRIPGTVWCWYPGHFSGPDSTMGNADVMLRVWENAGIDTKKPMAFFCGSASWGASISKLYGNVAGFDTATIYEGGWCEWQCDPNNPYETGIPEALKDYDPAQYHVELTKGGGHCR